MKWIKEIKLVGFKDWVWFVFRLQRNEFHSALDLKLRQYFSDFEINKVYEARKRAHEIELKLQEVN